MSVVAGTREEIYLRQIKLPGRIEVEEECFILRDGTTRNVIFRLRSPVSQSCGKYIVPFERRMDELPHYDTMPKGWRPPHNMSVLAAQYAKTRMTLAAEDRSVALFVYTQNKLLMHMNPIPHQAWVPDKGKFALPQTYVQTSRPFLDARRLTYEALGFSPSNNDLQECGEVYNAEQGTSTFLYRLTEDYEQLVRKISKKKLFEIMCQSRTNFVWFDNKNLRGALAEWRVAESSVAILRACRAV